MDTLDLGPIEYAVGAEIGPDSEQEEEAFRDADEARYIDRRQPIGYVCMDDRNLKPGIQLPGGLLTTRMAGRNMDSGIQPVPRSRLTEIVLEEIKDSQPRVHGPVCAGSDFLREALQMPAQYPSAASDFLGEAMEILRLPYKESDSFRAMYTGEQRALDGRLWDTGFKEELVLARKHPAVGIDNFRDSHQAAGLRFDATGNLFDNRRFRKDHVIDGREVGVLSVTMGAFRDDLLRCNEERVVATQVMYATLLTFGLAKYIGHDYLRVGIVRPLGSGSQE